MERIINFTTEFRAKEEEEDRYIEGYFIRYNEETELYPGFFEEVKREALEKTLDKDIRCLFNHDTSIVLGRTGNNTLILKSDDKGLYGKVKINKNDNQAMDILARIERQDINACSFGFDINDEEIEHRDDGTVKAVIKDIELFEVSPVTFPAYPTTTINARKNQVEEMQKAKLKMWREKTKERLNGIKSTDVK